ncbi:hypothetical protein L6164_028570 [Bauhinia variegata]|uniref:Uncharacterized protein n=1 Tax=Bauhinia variegata TaxID=167791 RepID=A0ACB9L6D1_BAUVA|nr:hypothetical protein L6164_028570 [Bauhinia variegata]
MGCFKCLEGLCWELSKMVRHFWWNNQDSSRKIHWVNCDVMCRRKLKGCLGFKDLRAFNLAPLAKSSWRLAKGDGSLFYLLFKGKYFPHSDFTQAKATRNISWGWRSILEGRTIFEKHRRWLVGLTIYLFTRRLVASSDHQFQSVS